MPGIASGTQEKTDAQVRRNPMCFESSGVWGLRGGARIWERDWAAASSLLAGFLFTINSCPSSLAHKRPGEPWYVFRPAAQSQT